MPLPPSQLRNQTDALRRDIAFLDQFGIEASKVRTRSEVVQRDFIEDGTHIPVFAKVYSYKKTPFQRLWRTGTARIEARSNFEHITGYQKDIDLLIKQSPDCFIDSYLLDSGTSNDQHATLRDAFHRACQNPKR